MIRAEAVFWRFGECPGKSFNPSPPYGKVECYSVEGLEVSCFLFRLKTDELGKPLLPVQETGKGLIQLWNGRHPLDFLEILLSFVRKLLVPSERSILPLKKPAGFLREGILVEKDSRLWATTVDLRTYVGPHVIDFFPVVAFEVLLGEHDGKATDLLFWFRQAGTDIYEGIENPQTSPAESFRMVHLTGGGSPYIGAEGSLKGFLVPMPADFWKNHGVFTFSVNYPQSFVYNEARLVIHEFYEFGKLYHSLWASDVCLLPVFLERFRSFTFLFPDLTPTDISLSVAGARKTRDVLMESVEGAGGGDIILT